MRSTAFSPSYPMRAAAGVANSDVTASSAVMCPMLTSASAAPFGLSRIVLAPPRVQTPVVTVATPAGDEPARNSADAAAGLLLAQQFRDPRSAEIARVTAARLRANCACTAGMVVRGTLPQLRELATTPGVRAVQALPADAIAGRFAVAPLLPEATGGIHAVLFGLGKPAAAAEPWLAGKLAQALPAGDYRFEGRLADDPVAAFAFACQSYRFERYRGGSDKTVRLKLGAVVKPIWLFTTMWMQPPVRWPRIPES